MYNWRRMTVEQQAEVLRYRRLYRYPLHSPPHFGSEQRHRYHLSAANYEHAPIVGRHPERLAAFATVLCATLTASDNTLHAWCALPNHYHALIDTADLKGVVARLGKMHGSTSFGWNREDNTRGRKCWHCCADRWIRSEAHFFTARNYIHHNPVKHGYVTKWDDWPFSSAKVLLDEIGRQEALRMWEKYPVLDMGEGWDWD
ncbi:MAG: hypothetical protein HN380_25850 [Victivallales bacterium]|jgi:putative transposase|nr:hypothetical protein [Victivallales bacterium]